MRNHRVLFLIAAQHFKIAGGIGQFYRGFSDFEEELDMYVDLCFDKAPLGSIIEGLRCNIIYPETSLSYKDHRAWFAFEDGINWESVLNFRNAIIKAFKANLYTHIISNTPEATIAIRSLGIKNVKQLTYTHSETLVQPESELSSNPTFGIEYLKEIRKLDGIDIGCQSDNIAKRVTDFTDQAVYELPFFFPKSEIPEIKPQSKTSGILFIGRWEDRKNPKVFIDLIKQTQLPAKVLTNKRGYDKFKKAFSDINHTDYEIKFDIIGKEKSDFISSARMAFCPNKAETGPFSVYESVTRTRTLIPRYAVWAETFKRHGVYTYGNDPKNPYKDKDLIKKVIEIYNISSDYTPLTSYQTLNEFTRICWQTHWFKSFEQSKKASNFRNKIMQTITNSPSETFTPQELIPESIYNQTSVNQLSELLICDDVNIQFTPSLTLISCQTPVNKEVKHSTLGGLFEF